MKPIGQIKEKRKLSENHFEIDPICDIACIVEFYQSM